MSVLLYFAVIDMRTILLFSRTTSWGFKLFNSTTASLISLFSAFISFFICLLAAIFAKRFAIGPSLIIASDNLVLSKVVFNCFSAAVLTFSTILSMSKPFSIISSVTSTVSGSNIFISFGYWIFKVIGLAFSSRTHNNPFFLIALTNSLFI